MRRSSGTDKEEQRLWVDSIIEEDHDKFLIRLRQRIDRVGINTPKIEEGYVRTGSRALPSLLNATVNTVEDHVNG